MENQNPETVNIRPGINILSILKHIEYEPWYALAEFIDNAIDSYQKHGEDIKRIEGANFKLVVKLTLNEVDNKITIQDNAAGIQKENYARAFRAAEIPPDNTGLSEFGMGMKSAACWFSNYWSVRTSAIWESSEKTVIFDLKKIFEDKLEELQIKSRPQQLHEHYTIIELCDIEKMPNNKTKKKIRDHLKSIYRFFINANVLDLYFNNELLDYTDPVILTAPFPYDSLNEPIYWRKEIDFEIEKDKLYVKGFVAIREKMSNNESGFALFRRGRVIEGSGEDGFRPKEIMGETGSPEYKRIFGELHLEGFEVSFTKKGIKWNEYMDIFLDLLKSDLNHPSFPLIKQAKEYRVKPTIAEIKKMAQTVVNSTVENIEKSLQPIIDEIRTNPVSNTDNNNLTETEETSYRQFEIDFEDTKWQISIELSYDSSINNWIEVGSHLIKNKINNQNIRQVGIRMSLIHPFIVHYAGTDKSKLEPILRIVAAIGLAEEAAREAGIAKIGTLRLNINKLLSVISK